MPAPTSDFIMIPLNRHLILCGFMGCGKSTVATLLANSLQIPIIELDQLICENTGLDIPSIFQNFGESYFRQAEKTALNEALSSATPTVISLGGGTPCNTDNYSALSKTNSVIVYLETSFATCLQRITNTDRPLLANSTADLQELYNKRLSSYESLADFVINTDQLTPEGINAAIISTLEKGTENV